MDNYFHSKYNYYLRKRFGQHFLKKKCFIDNIISIIKPQKGEILVEIGPGLGALTKPISEYLDSLIAIELDRDLTVRLKNHPVLQSKLTIYQQDVMNFDFSALSRETGQMLRIFGNLPYNISTPLMFLLFNHINYIKDMHFMMQKEVINRLVAKPSSKIYGRLSVMAQYYCQIIKVLEVPSHAFIPPPKIDSGMIKLIPYIQKTPHPVVNNINLLKNITRDAFNQRRKTLKNSLNYIFTAGALDELNINPLLRAENLTVSQYCQLANWLNKYQKINKLNEVMKYSK